MSKTKFKVGDKVEVIDNGNVYELYSKMFELFGFDNLEKNSCDNKDTGVIVATNKHEHTKELLYALNLDNGKQVVVNENGIELRKTNKPKTKSDYRLKVGDKVKLISTDNTAKNYGFDPIDMGKVGDVFTVKKSRNYWVDVNEHKYTYHIGDLKIVKSSEQQKTKQKITKTFKRNIPSDMLKVWQKLRKTNDPQLLAEHCEVSYITAIRFLTYGYVSKRKNVKLINDYFINVCGQQEKDVERLKKIAEKYDF